MNLVFDIFETQLGWVGMVASEKGLRRTTLPQPSPDDCARELGHDIDAASQSPERFEGLKQKVIGYFDGEMVSFEDESIDVDDASAFYREAWSVCRSIPAGETRTYKWLAEQAGKPNAPRAAGQSMARNRLPIVVPCHRVIGSDGGLRGFGKGATRLDLKQRLLDIEGETQPLLF